MVSIEEVPQLRRRLRSNQVYEDLRPRMKVALKVLEYNDVDKKVAYFSELVREMEGIVSRKTIHEALDSLIDQGSIRSEWVKNLKGRWVRGYRSASEGQSRLLRRTYYATHDDTTR